jgi:hypothetical protein
VHTPSGSAEGYALARVNFQGFPVPGAKFAVCTIEWYATSDGSCLRRSRHWVVLLPLNATNQSTKTVRKQTKLHFCVFSFKICENLGLQNDIPYFPDHLASIRFHHCVQGCRLHTHEFFGLSRWLINYLSGSFYPKNSKIFAFFL